MVRPYFSRHFKYFWSIVVCAQIQYLSDNKPKHKVDLQGENDCYYNIAIFTSIFLLWLGEITHMDLSFQREKTV